MVTSGELRLNILVACISFVGERGGGDSSCAADFTDGTFMADWD